MKKTMKFVLIAAAVLVAGIVLYNLLPDEIRVGTVLGMLGGLLGGCVGGWKARVWYSGQTDTKQEHI